MSITNLLPHKVAIITGAGRGIGRATAHLFAQAGAAVVLAARTAAEIEAVAEEIKSAGGKALAIPTDVTKVAEVDHLITLTVRAFRQIDVLVNNAGVLPPIGKTWEVDPMQWEKLLKVNVLGPYLCARAVLPQMLDRGDGRVINITSGAAQRDMVGWSAYCTSKAALDRFTTILAAEVTETDIVVCGVNPGITETKMQADIRASSSSAFPHVEKYRTYYEEGAYFRPEEPAQLILWLAASFGKVHKGAILDYGDNALRQQLAADLGLPFVPNPKNK